LGSKLIDQPTDRFLTRHHPSSSLFLKFSLSSGVHHRLHRRLQLGRGVPAQLLGLRSHQESDIEYKLQKTDIY
jgi:hypothetical protein